MTTFSKQKILIVSAHYAPYIHPRAYRWSMLAAHWAAQGHDVTVLCAGRSDLPTYELLNGVRVHRPGYGSLKDFFYQWLPKRRGEVQNEQTQTPKVSYPNLLLRWLNDKLWRSIYWPDDACLWRPAASKTLHHILQQQHFDHIISVSLPFTGHLIAYHAQSHFKNAIWTVDIGDPFSLQTTVSLNNRFLYQYKNTKWEQKILAAAQRISVTTEATRQLYIDKLNVKSDKIQVIAPIATQPITTTESSTLLDDGLIHIGYFGVFLKKLREPDDALRLFSKLILTHPSFGEHIRIHFVGDVFDEFLPKLLNHPTLKKQLILHGLVSRDQANNLMQQMQFLLNVGNQTNYQLPSKSVDYLLSGKPIINVSYFEKEPFRDFMQQHPLCLHLTNDVEDIDILYQFIKNNTGKTLDTELLKILGAPFQLATLAQKYLQP